MLEEALGMALELPKHSVRWVAHIDSAAEILSLNAFVGGEDGGQTEPIKSSIDAGNQLAEPGYARGGAGQPGLFDRRVLQPGARECNAGIIFPLRGKNFRVA